MHFYALLASTSEENQWLMLVIYCQLLKLRFIASFIAQQRCRASHPVGNRLRALQPLGGRNGAEEGLRLVACSAEGLGTVRQGLRTKLTSCGCSPKPMGWLEEEESMNLPTTCGGPATFPLNQF